MPAGAERTLRLKVWDDGRGRDHRPLREDVRFIYTTGRQAVRVWYNPNCGDMLPVKLEDTIVFSPRECIAGATKPGDPVRT